jgi:SAM-dependent methyltransferase
MKTSRTPSRRKEWFDDDSFWRELYPFMFPESRFASTAQETARILKLAKPRGRDVLDLCCGPGRFSAALARKGFRVTGVDRTPFLLAKARARARAARARVEWVKMDMRDFVRTESYDLALSLFTSFGYFDDRGEDLAVLRNLFASLRPGGVLVMDLMGKERLAKILLPTTSSTLDDGTVLVERHEIFDDWTRIRNEWIILRGGRARRFRFHHTVYSGQELRDRLERAGFARVRLYGSLAGAPYGPGAQRLIAVARKPGRRRAAGGGAPRRSRRRAAA